MSEHIEIECKNLLNQDEFNKLSQLFQLDEHAFIKQTNYYFDTEKYDLKNASSALRIREKGERFELTLKQPIQYGYGLLETNQDISAEEARLFIERQIMPVGHIQDKLVKLLDPKNLVCFGHLTTERAEVNYSGGLLALDRNTYFQTIDYEVEFEVDNYKEGQAIFANLMDEQAIPLRPTPNKVQRFHTEKVGQARGDRFESGRY